MTRAITAMPPRELRDFASPLLQVPLNRLFISRPIPRYIPPQDRNPEERTGCRTTPITSECMAALMVAAKEAENGPHTATTEVIKKRKLEEKKRFLEAKISQELETWKPKEYSGETITSDPFKTILVGNLSYAVTERLLMREFDRFGHVKKVSIVKDSKTGKPRGYAFVEFEREKDVRIALEDADGMRIEGRKIFVDVERGRTVDGWRPRRLGVGAGTRRLLPAKKKPAQPTPVSFKRPHHDTRDYRDSRDNRDNRDMRRRY